MNQVLLRAVRLLEQVAASPDASGVRDLARLAGLPSATCGRMLHDLAALGWVEQHSRRGFRLGPALPALIATQPYAGRLVAATKTPLVQLTRRMKAYGAVAVLRGERRVRVVVSGPQGAAEALDALDDLYRTASGRVLLAGLPWAQRQRLVAALGLPQPDIWPGVRTSAELRAELTAIRRAGGTSIHRSTGQVGFALLIPDGDGGMATVSAHRLGGGEELLAALRELAEQATIALR